jgi:hypothetical protein
MERLLERSDERIRDVLVEDEVKVVLAERVHDFKGVGVLCRLQHLVSARKVSRRPEINLPGFEHAQKFFRRLAVDYPCCGNALPGPVTAPWKYSSCRPLGRIG